MKFSNQVADALSNLKDFQRATVDHVIDRMAAGQRKFLIADEVGLGKTVVARGVIARLYEHEFSPRKDFRVVYVCSNQSLAKQNLDKLNFFREETPGSIVEFNEDDDRLSSLAYEPKGENCQYRLKIRALTPSTSFDTHRRLGKADERILLFRILSAHPDFKSRLTSLKWFLRGGRRIGEDSWTNKITQAKTAEYGKDSPYPTTYPPKIREEVYGNFHKQIRTPLSEAIQRGIFPEYSKGRTMLSALLDILKERKQDRSFEGGRDDFFKPYYRLIPELRQLLAICCKRYLKADLFILDEFQRFSQLLLPGGIENDGKEIAQVIFSDPSARVLLLSATPFKAYTNSYDEHNGENHYQEFRSVLQFLNPSQSDGFWLELGKFNETFHKGIKVYGNTDTDPSVVRTAKEHIETIYSGCMARTERALIETAANSDERNGIVMLKVTEDDIHDFVAIDKIIQAANESNTDKLSNPVEYVKSAAFPLSFLQDYDHHKLIKQAYKASISIRSLIKAANKAFLPLDRISAYKTLLPERSVNEPNPKLRLLYEETVRNNGYKLLWIPPNISYYHSKTGPFSNTTDFSKTLIFSAWKLVPRMTSALVSYEAERLSIGKLADSTDENERGYWPLKRRYPYPLLIFKNTDLGPSGMNNLLLAYPSIFLADLYDPISNVVDKISLAKVKLNIEKEIKTKLIEIGILNMGQSGGDVRKWDWYASLLLDRHCKQYATLKAWLQGPALFNIFDDENETDNHESDTHRTAKWRHLEEVRKTICNGIEPEKLGRLSALQLNRLASHLTTLCLGGAGVSAYRSVRRVFKDEPDANHLTAAFKIGLGFLSLFNKPESIAVVKDGDHANAYHQNALTYGIEGNIQSMLDEYLYQLRDSANKTAANDAADLVKDILMGGSTSIKVTSANSIADDKHVVMRTHYAVPFGTDNGSNLKNGKRQVKVREAFNSPFRPFVLTSTSIGQEGLDFHLYCGKIIHWNLCGTPQSLDRVMVFLN